MAPLSQLRNIADTGETLHRSGCAPYKIEKYLQFYARKQGINVIVQATPTSISCQFPDEDNQFIIRRLEPAQINLSLLARTIIRINAVEDPGIEEPGRYPGWLIMLANIAIPPAFLTLIGSALTTIALSAVLGFLVWLCQLFCRGDRVILVHEGEAAEFDCMVPHLFQAEDGPAEIISIFDRDGQRAHLHTADG